MKLIYLESFLTEMMKPKIYAQLVLCLMLLVVLLSFAADIFSDEAHPCDRKCITGARPKTCIYNWTIEHFLSLSRNCKNCPYEIADCYSVKCIPVDGVQRMITVINRQMPGPAINVCHGDQIVVNLNNNGGAEGTTIHWHGLNQVGTPYMDGVPMVTQCPIHPFTSFQYIFRAAEVGTHYYHSHVSFQRTEGVSGMLVVRQPKKNDPNRLMYDFDLPQHQILISDWMHMSGDQMYRELYHRSNFDYVGFVSILVNGRDKNKEFRNTSSGTSHYTPYSSFVVKKGSRYKFRVCSNANWACPIEISVVDHNLTVVGADGDSVVPIVVTAIVLNPGERFDFVINANRPIAKYWMLFRGLLRCEITKVVGRAILKYETANDVEIPEPQSNFRGRILNPIHPFGTNNSISLFQLRSHTPPDESTRRVRPDKKLFIPFNFYPNLNPAFATSALLAMVNSIAFLPPPSPLLSTFPKIPKRFFCSNMRKNCSAEFCQCTYILKVRIGWVVEIILIDEGPIQQFASNHPWHLHGHHFRVMGGDLMVANNTAENIKKMDDEGKIRRNFDNPVLKDTVNVPRGGYTIIRFHATNPGFWALHCHLELHTETGMMLVLQVGEWEFFPKPPLGFPTCGDFPMAQ